ncbi:hypothetical protein [Faecalibacterium prausnitzii]|jgi:ABC-type transport system involved in Fe-S cluster assembly fused permease/ATPase subunit|uniref:hypothetical protein n=1 Tax=Faecalibacterium prausnitzii TaxID=853 RepID=UPI0022E0A82F|nr:hypothetical protein [Faecalibacterium prausnitzii]
MKTEKPKKLIRWCIIAHRMRTVSSAGKIVVLKDGVVAEQGSLAQLLHTMKPPSLKICI